MKSVLIAQNEVEVNKLLEANKSATGSADALNDKTWNLGLFNITIRGDKKDEHADDPNKKKNKSGACSIQWRHLLFKKNYLKFSNFIFKIHCHF